MLGARGLISSLDDEPSSTTMNVVVSRSLRATKLRPPLPRQARRLSAESWGFRHALRALAWVAWSRKLGSQSPTAFWSRLLGGRGPHVLPLRESAEASQPVTKDLRTHFSLGAQIAPDFSRTSWTVLGRPTIGTRSRSGPWKWQGGSIDNSPGDFLE